MNICVIGAGYVGLTTAAVLASLGHTVCCVDTNIAKVEQLRRGEVPIYEPGLSELISKYNQQLTFSSDPSKSIKDAEIIFIAVGTPSLPDGGTDLTYVYSLLNTIAKTIDSYKTIIMKSTVPPGTNEELNKRLVEKGVNPQLFNIISNPEFLREGTAISDMLYPDRIVVGKHQDDRKSLVIIKKVYQKIIAPYVVTSLSGAEMIKYTSNAFLATKISFINEISRICDQFHVNIEDVKNGIGLDRRIGRHFLSAGLGYGGSCFPKDVSSLEKSALDKNVTPLILQAVQSVNHSQVELYIHKLSSFIDDFSNKQITVLGIAFKPNTDDTRYSRALALIERLSVFGCMIHAYDPKAQLPSMEKENIVQHTEIEQALKNADCVVIATEWNEFKHLDWHVVKKLMKGNIVMDARNCIDPNKIREAGLKYVGVARP